MKITIPQGDLTMDAVFRDGKSDDVACAWEVEYMLLECHVDRGTVRWLETKINMSPKSAVTISFQLFEHTH